eukprot:352587-Chlamydomonas_euryale.AAC.5
MLHARQDLKDCLNPCPSMHILMLRAWSPVWFLNQGGNRAAPRKSATVHAGTIQLVELPPPPPRLAARAARRHHTCPAPLARAFSSSSRAWSSGFGILGALSFSARSLARPILVSIFRMSSSR